MAIIVILAIIAVITVPIILNIIENSRKGAATDSAYGYKDAVQKNYVTELSKPENRELILQGEYTVKANGVLDGNGISNKEIPVSGEKPSAGELHYSNNELKGGCLVIGDYSVIFEVGNATSTTKGDCSDYEYSSENSGSSSNEQGNSQVGTPLTIGASVTYSTTLNNQILNKWKVFLSDVNYTYLIYDDFLASPISPESKDALIIYMRTTSNWNDLLVGTLNENISINQTSNSSAYAMESPTVELWENSWNSKYSDIVEINLERSETADSNGLYSYDTDSDDEYYNGTETYNNDLENGYAGNEDLLFFPYPADEISGYYLADAAYYGNIVVISNDGVIRSDDGMDTQTLRPIIKLPTSILNQ